jgi:hypothetical protein
MYLLNQRDKSINSYCSFAIPVLRYHIGSSTMSIIRVTVHVVFIPLSKSDCFDDHDGGHD